MLKKKMFKTNFSVQSKISRSEIDFFYYQTIRLVISDKLWNNKWHYKKKVCVPGRRSWPRCCCPNTPARRSCSAGRTARGTPRAGSPRTHGTWTCPWTRRWSPPRRWPTRPSTSSSRWTTSGQSQPCWSSGWKLWNKTMVDRDAAKGRERPKKVVFLAERSAKARPPPLFKARETILNYKNRFFLFEEHFIFLSVFFWERLLIFGEKHVCEICLFWLKSENTAWFSAYVQCSH